MIMMIVSTKYSSQERRVGGDRISNILKSFLKHLSVVYVIAKTLNDMKGNVLLVLRVVLGMIRDF